MPPTDNRRVLLLFAHPAFSRSRANRVLLEAARSVAGITIHDLYEAYPDFDVDVRREQELLLEHDAIVVQHPFYWYSTPALIKQWEDLVLEHGWAYGSSGNALRGKLWMHAITAGGGEGAYCAEGSNRYSIRELLRPLEQTAVLCEMRFLAPFMTYGTLEVTDATLAKRSRDYARLLGSLRDGSLDLEQASAQTCLYSSADKTVGGA